MYVGIRGASTKFEKRILYPTVPLTLGLNKISVRGTAIYEGQIWHFAVGVQALKQHFKT